MLPVLFRRRLPLIITTGGTIGIITGAITTGITTGATTICTGVGLAVSMGAPGIIAIGERYYCAVGVSPVP